jgi:hypothetical protein
MSHSVCLKCGAREFGSVFWRIRGPYGTLIAERPSLAACQEIFRKYSATWGARIYRVTRRPRPLRMRADLGPIVTVRAAHLAALAKVVECAWRIRLGYDGKLPIVVGLADLIEALKALEAFQ